MTDDTHTDNTDSQTDTDNRAERKPPATDAGHTTADETAESADESTGGNGSGCKRTMKDMNHTPPVDVNRTFERKEETEPAKTDGGRRAEVAEETSVDEDEQDEDAAKTDDSNQQFRQTVGDIDHSSPVAGPNRTFERGDEDHDDTE